MITGNRDSRRNSVPLVRPPRGRLFRMASLDAQIKEDLWERCIYVKSFCSRQCISTQALLDTGSCHNWVTEHFAKTILGYQTRPVSDKNSIVCGNGQPMVVLGEVTLDWTSPSRSGNTVFLVTEVLAQYNVLFGQASVTEYFMDRDFQFALLMNPPTEDEKAKMEKEKVKSEQRIATNLAEAARREKKKEEKIRDRRTNGFSWWVRRSGERSL